MPHVNLYLHERIAELRREEERRRAAIWRLLRQTDSRQRPRAPYQKPLVPLRRKAADRIALSESPGL